MSTPRIATIIPAVRGSFTPTTLSGPTPWAIRWCASRLAAALSPAASYTTSPATSAVAPGLRAASASNTAGNVAGSTATAGPCPRAAIRRRSPSVSRDSSRTGRSGSAATWSSSTSRCPAIRPAVAASNSSVLYSSSPRSSAPSAASSMNSTLRSKVAHCRGTSTLAAVSPAGRGAFLGALCSSTITSNSGLRLASRRAPTASTSRWYGVSSWAKASSTVAAAPASSAR
ncbi:hypothetical protein Shyhy02_08960 [Streptomyces hygroscopicus subsp. hygroscopicus]|nr:hypothetical protein Shyhy02_08960 [Streptomyces hygroscopicus subsp. hygroscopicus]